MPPESQKLLIILLQLSQTTTLSCGAHDQVHLLCGVHLGDQLFEALADPLILDLSTHPTPARVGTQDQITPRESNITGESGTLVAHLLFVDLDNQLSPIAKHILDAGASLPCVAPVIESGVDIVQGDKAVTPDTKVDKSGLEAGLYIDHTGFINITAELLIACHGDIEILHYPILDDHNADLIGLCRVHQHLLAHLSPAWSGLRIRRHTGGVFGWGLDLPGSRFWGDDASPPPLDEYIHHPSKISVLGVLVCRFKNLCWSLRSGRNAPAKRSLP